MTSLSTRAASPAPECLYRYRITADRCPQVLLRILGLIAQHVELPGSVACTRHDDRIDAEVAIDSLSPERAEILRLKLAAIVTVRDVVLLG